MNIVEGINHVLTTFPRNIEVMFYYDADTRQVISDFFTGDHSNVSPPPGLTFKDGTRLGSFHTHVLVERFSVVDLKAFFETGEEEMVVYTHNTRRFHVLDIDTARRVVKSMEESDLEYNEYALNLAARTSNEVPA